jgi:NAD(P)H-hydrate epimerase
VKSAEPVHDVPRLLPRAPDSHKGTYGKVLIVAGARGMAGAAILAARAALRCGSGLVTVAIPEALSNAVTAAVPEATQILLPELRSGDGRSPPEHLRDLHAALGGDREARFDALAVGPGIGTLPGSKLLLEAVTGRWRLPQVLDADALNLIASGARLEASAERVWTPHPGELRRLTGESPEGDHERVAACGRFLERRGGVVVLKGHRTVVHDGERYYLNLTGNPGMATGGAGDVLTGMIASLLGQGFAPFAAARLGVYLHGLAGDLAVRRLGQASLTAGDLVEYLPAAVRDLTAAAGPGPRRCEP